MPANTKVRYIKFEATNAVNYGWGVKMREFQVFKNEPTVLTTFTYDNTFVKTGEPFTITALDQYDDNFTVDNYTLTNAEKVGDNQFKAKEEGKVVIAAGDKKIILNAVSKDETAYNAPITDEVVHDGTQGTAPNGQVSQSDWNQHYGKLNIFDFDGNKMLAVTNVGTFGVHNGNITGTGFTKLHFNIYSTKAVDDAYVKLDQDPSSDLQKIDFKLKEGWNSIDLDITGATVFTTWVQLYLGTAGSAENPDILLDNVYFSKGTVEVVEDVTVAKEPNARGFYAVTGVALKGETISAALSDPSITAYDFTGLKLKAGNSYTVKPANPNALIYVAGDGGNDFKPTADWGETKNVVGGWNNSADNWYVPATSIEYEDKGETPVYTNFFISAKSARPLNYTRSIPAKSFVSTFLPVDTEIPEGIKVYEFAKGTNSNVVDLKEATTINQHTPYLLYNGNSKSTELKFSATGDVRILNGAGNGNEQKDVEIGNVTVHGTYSYIKTTGNESYYAISANSYDADGKTLKLAKVNGGQIVPFRVYFTVPSEAQAAAMTFMLPGEVTGINDINAAEGTKAADIYSVDGRLVKKNATSFNGLESGIYIMDGKKYVVK